MTVLDKLEVIAEAKVPAADIFIYANGIMHIHIKVVSNFEIEHSMQIVEARTKLADKSAYPILYTTESSFVTPSKEVTEYVSSEGRSELVLADAFIIKSLPQRLAAKAYFLFKKPVRPTSFFSKQEVAMSWLENFLD